MIPFSPPHIDQKIINEVIDCLNSGWITTGPKTRLLEKRLCEYTGAEATLCLNSATAGLEAVLRWFGVKEGDEVILPAYTYTATANVIVHCGAIPVFVDVNDDFNISTTAIAGAITNRTKVIMPVDFGGWPCDYDRINSLVLQEKVIKLFKPHNDVQAQLGRILILSDASHAIGATYKGKKTGTLTDVSVFSFHAVKNITTAEGGAVALNLPPGFDNNEIYKCLAIKTNQGQSKDALSKIKPGAWRYDVVEAGYKSNMTDILASIGLVELERYDSDTLPKRKEIVGHYNRLLNDYPWAILPTMIDNNSESSYHLYPLRIKNISETERDVIIERVSSMGISVNVHFIPVPMLSFYRGLGYDIADYPITYNNYKTEISLPVFYDLTLNQIEEIVHALCSAVDTVATCNATETDLADRKHPIP